MVSVIFGFEGCATNISTGYVFCIVVLPARLEIKCMSVNNSHDCIKTITKSPAAFSYSPRR